MSAAEGSREPPKAKGKTLGGFFSSLPGFGSARNLLANAHSSAREARPREDPAGAKPQAQGATELGPTAKGTEKPPTDEIASGVANVVEAAEEAVQEGLGTACSAITGTKDALSTGVLGAVGVARGIVQGGLDTTKTALTGTKDTVSAGLTGAVNVAKGTVQTGLDTSKAVLTGTKDTVSAGLTGAVNVAKGTVQTGLDTSKAVLTGTKDTVSAGLTGAVNMAKGTVQTGVDTSKAVLTGTKDTMSAGLTGAVNMAKGTVQTGLDTSKAVLTRTKDTMSAGLTGAVNVAKGTVQTGVDTSKAVLTGTKDTMSAGLTGAMNVAKGTVQTGVDTSKAVLTGTKDTVSAGLTGAMNVAKGTVQTGLDTSKAVLTGTKDTVSAGLTGAVNVAKGTVQTGLDTSKAVLTGTKDTVSAGLTGAMNVAKVTVQTGLDTSKAVLTGSKDTVSAGLTGAMNVAKVTVQTGLDTSKAVLTGTKTALCSGVTGIEGAFQGGLDTLQTVLPGPRATVSAGLPGAVQRGLTTAIHSRVTGAMNVATGAVQGGLGATEAMSSGLTGAGDILGVAHAGLGAVHALPPDPEDTAWGSDRASTTGRGPAALSPRDALAAGQEATLVGKDIAPDVATPGGERAGQREGATGFSELRDEFEGLGEIFHPMTAEEQARLAASQPEPTVLSADRGSYFVRLGDLAPAFRQRAFEHALSHLQHGQFQARAALARLQESFQLIENTQASGQPALDQGTGATDTSPLQGPDASGALAQARGLLQQLHRAYSGLAAGLQGLPPELQQLLGRARHTLCDLYGIVAAAGCAQELPAERLAQSRAAVSQAWQGLERRLEGLQHSPPLGWLVGPFALLPRGQQL